MLTQMITRMLTIFKVAGKRPLKLHNFVRDQVVMK